MQATGQAEPFQLQYEWLIAALQAECSATGSLGIAAGGIPVRISEVSPPDVGEFPAIGVQFVGRTNQPDGMRTRTHTNKFEITIAWDMAFDTSEPDIERALKNAVEKLLNDKQGNGVLPVLYRDITLGQTAIISYDEEIISALALSPEDPASASGRIVISFIATAEQRVVVF